MFFPLGNEREGTESCGSVPAIALHPAKVKLLLGQGTVRSYIAEIMRNIFGCLFLSILQAQFSSLQKGWPWVYCIYFVLYGHIEKDFCFLSKHPLQAFQAGGFQDGTHWCTNFNLYLLDKNKYLQRDWTRLMLEQLGLLAVRGVGESQTLPWEKRNQVSGTVW